MKCVCVYCLRPEWKLTDDDMDEFDWQMYDESNEDGKYIWEVTIDLHERGTRMPERLH